MKSLTRYLEALREGRGGALSALLKHAESGIEELAHKVRLRLNPRRLSSALTDDIRQELTLKLLSNRGTSLSNIRHTDEFVKLARVMMRNSVVDCMRTAKRSLCVELRDIEDDRRPESMLIEREEQDRRMRAIAVVSDADKESFGYICRHAQDGEPMAAIADTFGYSVRTLQRRLRTFRVAVQTQYERER